MTTLPVLLLTRPDAAARAFAETLQAEGAGGFAPLISPLIGIEVAGPPPDLAQCRGVIFTSANAVAAFVALGGQAQGACFTVGAATAQAAAEAGFTPHSADGDAEALIALITGVQPPGPLMHLRGRHSRGDIAKTLISAGIETHDAVLYEQPVLDLTPEARVVLTQRAPIIVPLFSPRTAARFAEVCPEGSTPWIAAMSGSVADEVQKLRPARLCICARPTGIEMRKTTAMLIDEARMLESRKGAQ